MSKKIILPVIALAILGMVVFEVSSVKADELNNTRHQSIIQKLVAKFGLNETDVEAVFEEERTERQVEMEVRKTERLDQLVTEGKITSQQKDLILAKQEEMRNQFGLMRDLTPEERKTQMEAKRNEMHTWADLNGIDLDTLGPIGGFGGKGGGMGGGRGR